MRHERSHGSRRNTQVGHLMAGTEGPQTVRLRIVRCTLEEQHGTTQQQRAGDEQRPHEPAQVRDPEHPARFVNIEEIGPVMGRFHPKATVGEYGPLGAPSSP